MLASGAHVKIGNYEFLLDETIDAGTAVGNLYRPHYRYTANSLFNPKLNLPGSDNEQNIRPERLLWYIDDWSGGGGRKNFNEQDTSTYGSSVQMNPRIQGQLQGPPARVFDNSSWSAAITNFPQYFKNAIGTVWVAGGYKNLQYVSNFTTSPWTWTTLNTTGVAGTDFAGMQHLSATYRITAMAGDGNYIYYSCSDSGSGKRILYAHTLDNASIPSTVEAETAGTSPAYAGLARLGPFLYAWTGTNLYTYDVTAAPAWGVAVLQDSNGTDLTAPFTSPHVFETNWWADIVAAESSVFYFYATEGKSYVNEYSRTRGVTPIWNPPDGVTIKGIAYHNGVVWLTVQNGGEQSANGRGELWAIPLDTRRATLVHTMRQYSTTTWGTTQNKTGGNSIMGKIVGSYRNQVMFSNYDSDNDIPSVYIYDADFDAVSVLDDYSTSAINTDGYAPLTNRMRVTGMITHGNRRLVDVYDKNGAQPHQVFAYKSDDPSEIQASTASGDASGYQLMSPQWDFDLPFEQKALMGVDLTFSPLTAGQSIDTYFYLDDSTTPVTATTLNFASSDSQKGRTYIPISTASTMYKFTRLRVMITPRGKRTSGTNYAPPVVYSIAVEAQPISYERTWDLILRLKNPQTATRSGKAGTTMKGDTQRGYIRAIVDTQSIVTFLDGYPYQTKGAYDTHSVTIEDPEDIIIKPGEGSMKITLREVPR